MLEELVRHMAGELLGRGDLSAGLLAETAARLEKLAARLRVAPEGELGDLFPAVAFDPGHPAYHAPPAVPAGALEPLGQGSLSGYAPYHPPEVGAGYPEPAAGELGPAGPGGRAEGSPGAPDGEPARPVLAASDPLSGRSLVELAQLVRGREVSAEELTRAVLDRIDALDGRLRSFVTVTREAALAAARAADRALLRGQATGPLHGLPVALKDVVDVAGLPTTAGSAAMEGYVPNRDATAWRRLRAAGAILVGKTATHEFAFGATTDTPFHGPVHNPWAPGHVAGGSSGGSGAAVAARLVPCALGTDTGGSVRIPAAACGVVGVKPTYGRVSRFGVLPLSWSLDHVGIITRTVADAALVLGVLAGPDPLDPAAADRPVPDYLEAVNRAEDLRGVRVGVLGGWLAERVEGGVRGAVERAAQALAGRGAAVELLGPGEGPWLPPLGAFLLVNRVLALAEGAAYHAPRLAQLGERYSPDVRARLELGQFLTARHYLVAQRLRTELCRRMAALMARFHVLVTPTLPIPAPRLGQATWPWPDAPEPVPDALIRLVAPFNVTGQPAVSVPAGLTPEGLPVGLQLVGRPFDEATVLRVAQVYQASGEGLRG